MKNKMQDLRNHLFATLEGLHDKENPMEIERARTIAGVAQVIVNSAKVECEFMEISGFKGSGFIDPTPALEPPCGSQKPRVVSSR